MRLNTGLFYLGLVIAIILGIGNALDATWGSNKWLLLLLVVIGLVVGFMNINQKETTAFLVGSVAFVLASALANLTAFNTLIPSLGTFLQAAINGVALIVAPAALVVSFKSVYNMCR